MAELRLTSKGTTLTYTFQWDGTKVTKYGSSGWSGISFDTSPIKEGDVVKSTNLTYRSADRTAGVKSNLSAKNVNPVVVIPGEEKTSVSLSASLYSFSPASYPAAGTYSAAVDVYDFVLVVEYESGDNRCQAPTYATLSASAAEPGKLVHLTWGGAAGSKNNDLVGYDIESSDSSDRVSWTNWEVVGSTSDTWFDVESGEEGTSRRFRIRAKGTAGEEFFSDWFIVPDTLYSSSSIDDPTVTKCSAPITGRLETNTVQSSEHAVNLTWSGAQPGLNNFIVGYSLEYNDYVGEEWTGWKYFGEASNQSASVVAGDEHVYRKFRVRAVGSAGAEYNSNWYMIEGQLYHQDSPSDLPNFPANPQNTDEGAKVESHSNMPPYRAVYIWRRVE